MANAPARELTEIEITFQLQATWQKLQAAGVSNLEPAVRARIVRDAIDQLQGLNSLLQADAALRNLRNNLVKTK